MLDIDREVLSHISRSPYRAAFERGYRWLRFDPQLESEFQRFYTQAHLHRVRLAGCVGIVMFGLFVIIDMATLPSDVWPWTARIRAGLSCLRSPSPFCPATPPRCDRTCSGRYSLPH
ncbi:MAG: hypothetical protein M3Q51_03010 [Pseudomonadota bacterium]|nr:hypothetical protein [Pseudomonadota bacterium]MDQ3159974.1 hypothetical protein [Pseudomonadota bacterium]